MSDNLITVTAHISDAPIMIFGEQGDFYIFKIAFASMFEGELPVFIEVIVKNERLFPIVKTLRKHMLVKIKRGKIFFKSRRAENCKHRIIYPKIYAYEIEVLSTKKITIEDSAEAIDQIIEEREDLL